MKEYVEAAVGTCGFARGFGIRLKKTIELLKDQLLARKMEL